MQDFEAQLVSERCRKVCSLTCREVPAGPCSTDIAGKQEEVNLCFHVLHRSKREDVGKVLQVVFAATLDI